MNYDNACNKTLCTVFVYQHKNTGEISVRYHDSARILENDDEWEHLSTLEPRQYINNLLVEYPALARKMRGES